MKLDSNNVTQIRIARPTDKMPDILRFYQEGLGFEEIGSFTDHNGYSGVMLQLPDSSCHLEFTEHEAGSPCPAPTRDNLLVLYIPDKTICNERIDHMKKMGYSPVPPENPYWKDKGVTFEDPDGWRVVLMNTPGI